MKDCEPQLERGQRDRVRVDEARIQQLVRGFATDWKRSIESLNQDVMQSFSNFKTGTYILQVSIVYSTVRGQLLEGSIFGVLFTIKSYP